MASRIFIKGVVDNAECQVSRKTGVQCVEIESEDGSIRAARVSLPELVKLLRFLQSQGQSNGGNGKPADVPTAQLHK